LSSLFSFLSIFTSECYLVFVHYKEVFI